MSSFNLSPENEGELVKFMKYFSLKKEEFFKDRKRDLNDFLSDSMNDEIYNKDDVENIFQKYYKENESYSEKDLTLIIHLASSYLQNILSEAESNKVELHVDMSSIENNQIIEKLKLLELNYNPSDAPKSKSPRRFTSKLPALNAAYNNDPALTSRISDLEKEIEALRMKNKKMQQDLIETTKTKKENNFIIDDYSLKSEEEYKDEIATIQKKMSSKDNEKEELKQELDALKEELNKKLSESVQVGNLKKMIQNKNDLIKTLKTKLSKHEKVENID